MKILLVYPNMPLQFSLPHSIGRISSALKQKGHEVRLFDTTLYPPKGRTDEEKRIERGQIKPYKVRGLKQTDMIEDFKECIKVFRPNKMMITFVDNTIDIGMKLLESNKRPIPTIAGGVSVILGPKRFKTPLIDTLWRGSIESFVFPENPEIELMDDWTVFEQERLFRPMSGKYYKTIPLLTSYGCPFSCGFCCAPSLRNVLGHRKKSLENTIRELEFQLKTHKPEFIYFSSETFLSMPMPDFREFADVYKGISLPFWCQTSVNTINEERAELLKEMNCHRVAMGIESGDERYRKEMIGGKNFTNELAIRAFRILSKAGVSAAANNIIGFPMETLGGIEATVNLNKKIYEEMPDVQLNCYIFQPYHGTRLREFCETKGLLRKQCPDTVLGDPVIYNPYVSDDKLREYRDHFYEKVTGKRPE